MFNTMCKSFFNPTLSSHSVEEANLTVNEKILQECYQLYTEETSGLISMGKVFSVEFLPPRKKVVILLLGNHSAGKSSFINWYIKENIQKTGVAIETQGFTFIQQGKRRETLLADGALRVLPRFNDLKNMKGIEPYVSMELSTSQERKFNLATFIDSPGLVDGGMEYPFDVNEALLFLGRRVDLIFIFFDPIGQALCKRTLQVVKELSAIRNDGIHFVLSKVDETGNESDRQKVLTQIVQELCKVPGVSRQGFEIKSIYVKNMDKEKSGANHIEDICGIIDKTVQFTVQKTITNLEIDCTMVEAKIDRILKEPVKQSYIFVVSIPTLLVAIGVAMENAYIILAGIMSIFIWFAAVGITHSLKRRPFIQMKEKIKWLQERKEQLMTQYLLQSIASHNAL